MRKKQTLKGDITLTTRQVPAWIRHKKIPDSIPDGRVECPSGHWLGDTESPRFWESGMHIFCDRCEKEITPVPKFPLKDGRTVTVLLPFVPQETLDKWVAELQASIERLRA